VIYERLPSALSNHPDGMTRTELLAFLPDEARGVQPALLALFGLQWLIQMNADGTGYLAQRCMACRTDRDAQRATLVFSWLQIVVRSLLWLPIGLSLLVLMPPATDLVGAAFTADREASYVRGMMELLPPGARGLLLAAMLAALASTLDTHINWGASYFTNDLYGRLYCGALRGRHPKDRELVIVARLASLAIVVIALIVMTQLSSIQSAWKVSLLLGSGMGIMLLLRWMWWRITALGELACIVTSSVLSPVLLWWLPDSQEALRLLVLASVATFVGIGVSLAFPARDQASLNAFYARVRPPGFWAPMARACAEREGAAPARLRSGLLRTVAASLSLFCALVGLGSWLVGSTPTWLPSSALWSFGLLASSALLATAALTRAHTQR
jgi:Na+/proline symporter